MADGAHVADVHVDVHPDTSGFEQELRQKLRAIAADVRTNPDTKTFAAELKAQLRALPDFKVLVAPDTTGFRTKLEASLRKMTAVGVNVTPDTTGFRAELKKQLAALPSVALDVDNTAALAKVAAVGNAIKALPNTINLDVDTGAALASIAALRAAMAAPATINVDVDTAAAAASIASLRAALTGLGNVDINITATVTGLKDVRAMATAVAKLKPLAGRIDIDVNATAAGPIKEINRLARAVKELRATAAGTITVDVDVLATGPLLDIVALNRAIRSLQRNTFVAISIHVIINPPGVMTHLIALHGILSRLRGFNARANVSIGTSSARSAIQLLIATAIGIAPAIIPVAAAATAAIGAIGPAAFTAAAGIGVIALAFNGVFDAVKALGDAQSKAGKTAGQYAQRQQQIANAQDQVRDAHRGVHEAERNLANAQRDALRAQRDINRAREEAKEALEDLDSAVKNNSLSIRQAKLDLADAEKELAAVSDLPVDDRRRVEAQLQYDQAAQALDDLTTRQGRLATEQQKAQKAGIEGSEQVQAAQEKAADAQERVRDAAIALTRAQEQVIQAQRNLQTTIQTTSATGGAAVDTLADKMAALSPAGQAFARFLHSIRDQFKQVKAAAEAGLFPGLQRGIEALLPVLPQISLFVGRVAQAMGDLFEAAGKALASPFWVNFFDYMGQTAAPLLQAIGGIIGGLARGFASLLVAFTPFSIQFMRGLAGMAQAFADWAASLADSDGFNSFIEYVKREGPKVLKLLGDFVIAVVKLGIAFAPLGSLILRGLVALFDYLAAQSPGHLVAIAAGIGAIMLAIAAAAGGPITVVVAAITLIAGAAVYAYTKLEWFKRGVDTIFNAAKLAVTTFVDAFRRGGDDVKNTGFLGAIERVGQQARRIFDGIKEAWDNFVTGFTRGGTQIQQGGFAAYMQNLGMVARNVFEWMRDKGIPAVAAFLEWIGPKAVTFVKATWQVFEVLFAVLNRVFAGITTVIGAAWQYSIKPTFDMIAWVVRNMLAPTFTWLWNNIIEPVWNWIKLGIQLAWASIQVVFGLIQIGIKILAGTFMWLWEAAIRPAWDGIQRAIKAGWDFIRPIFETFGNFIDQHVAPRFASAVEGLKKIWGGLSEGFRVVVRFVVEDLINNGILAAYNWLADKFNVNPKNVRVNVPGLTSAPPSVGGGGGGAPKYYARGGPVWGAGTATSDSIPAMLSNGEYVIPAHIVKAMGVSFFDWLIGRQKRMPGAPGGNHGLPGFALGGLVDFAKKAWETLSDPIGALKDKALGLVGNIPNLGLIKDVMAGVARHTIGGIIEFAKEKFSTLFFGPDRGGTGNFATGKFDRTPGGWPARQYHVLSPNTAAALAMLLKTWGPPAYSDHYRVGPFDHPWGKAIDFMSNSYSPSGLQRGNEAASWMINHPGVFGLKYVIWRQQVTSGSGWKPYVGDSPHTDHVHFSYFNKGGPVGAAPGYARVPYLFRDGGGMVPPGLSLVDNRTGRDEWMFNDRQVRDILGNRSRDEQGQGRRRGGDVHIDTFNAYRDQSPHDIARDLDWLARHGG